MDELYLQKIEALIDARVDARITSMAYKAGATTQFEYEQAQAAAALAREDLISYARTSVTE